jgi:sulfur-carrier protein adenylyltransferase/sulfurtransferase
MNWALRDPVRFLHERDEFEKLLKEAPWVRGLTWRLDQTLTVEVEIDLDIHGATYAMRLTYPDLFPETPPYIRPRDPTHVWSGHQYGPGGALCLEWRADNWDSRITGADLVRSAYKLLSTESNPTQPAEVPSAHQLTPGQELRSSEHRFVCTPELMSMLASTTTPAARRLRTNTILHKKVTVGFISRFEQGDSMQAIADLPKGVSTYGPLFAWRRDGHLFKSDVFDHPTAIASVDELINVVHAAGFSQQLLLLREPGDRLVLLVGPRAESLQVFSLSLGENPTLQEYSVLLPEQSLQRLPPQHERLQEIRVGIVGLGSLGSKIAVSLGRSGIRKFLLIDDDVLMPGNVCRHELSWESVGMHKADAVREALTLIAPNMDIEVRVHRVAGQESSMTAATALKDLTSCDLLIDATANPEVFLRLAAVARVNRVPMCWGEVFAGGFSGLIARARPDIDPHPVAVQAAILNYLGTLPPAPHQRAEGYNIGGEEPVVAYDSEVAQIAAALTRFALDIALRKSPSDFPYSAYLIGLRKEWIFSQPFDTHPIEITGEGWSKTSGPSFRDEDRTEVLNVLLRIAAEGQHANADSST